MNIYTFYVTQTPGRCRWCRCTEREPCAGGCGWANREQTVCTACVPLDAALRTVPGRRELAEFLQEHEFLNPTKQRGTGASKRSGGFRRHEREAR